MLSENHNNSDWKNKLEDENGLSSKILYDKNAVWEKLHNRLQEKPNRKKILWQWLTAACLLPAIVISLMYLLSKEDKAVKNIVIKEKVVKPENQTQYVKADTIAAIFPIPNREKKTVKIKLKSNNDTIASADKEHLEANIQIADNEIIPPIPFGDSSNTANIATAQPKKKLKVVHINELGEPAEELPITARNTNLHYFQLKLANQEVYMSKSLTSHNSGVNLLKIKSSASN